jgi:hypothetical protein
MLLTRLLLAAVLVENCVAAVRLPRSGTKRGNTIALRRRLHVNTLITEPGHFEMEWSNAFSMSGPTSGSYMMPTTLKHTPEGTHHLWGRTEYSVSFDGVSRLVEAGGHLTQFSDHMGVSATCAVLDGERLDIAIAPQVSFFLRDEKGARVGATAIARYDWGRNSAGATLTWTGATASSSSNPAGLLDLGAGYGRKLFGPFTAHGNYVYEKGTGFERQMSLFEGVEYQISERVALDFSGQHFGVAGGLRDNQWWSG